MNKKLYTENEITIQASTAAVWDALTNPEKTQTYMFGCEVLSDWNIGDSLLWKGAADGIVYVKGHIVSLEKEKEWTFTIFDPNATYEDIPENYLVASYTLTTDGESTHLKVTQGDYNTVAEGQKRYQDSMAQGGWAMVLEAIKKLAE